VTDRPPLTSAVRDLLWTLRREVDVVTGLSRQIDAHVRALNAARTEMAERLERLDALLAATDEPHLSGFLHERVVVTLPVEDEVIPPRLAGT
jgi:hypothetical protein